MLKDLHNLNKATGEELVWLRDHRCKLHGHRYTTHFNCFLKDRDGDEVRPEKKGFLDIECSNLSPAFGIVLCWCIKDGASDTIRYDYITKQDLFSPDEDKRIIETCIDTMKQYDRIIGHYSSRFDIPFLRTRAVQHDNIAGLGFPKHGELFHTDTWLMARSKFKFHSNRQNIVAETLFNSTIKTRIDHRAWRQALQGNQKAIMETVDHCERDALELEQNFNAMLPYYKITNTSI